MSWRGEERRTTGASETTVRAIAQEVVEQAAPAIVRQTLTSLGFDVSDPLRAQEQFAYLRKAVERESDPQTKADRAWTRSNRTRCESIASKVILILAGTATVALTGWTVTGLVHWTKAKLGLS